MHDEDRARRIAHDPFGGAAEQDVDQATAENNRVAHAEGFERRSQQHAAANRARQIDIVRDHHVVDHGLQNLVDFAFRSE